MMSRRGAAGLEAWSWASERIVEVSWLVESVKQLHEADKTRNGEPKSMPAKFAPQARCIKIYQNLSATCPQWTHWAEEH